MEKILREVYYYNDNFYYKIDLDNKNVLLNKKGHLKQVLILDITKNTIYKGKKEFLSAFADFSSANDEILVNEVLSSLKFKVYKKIKLRIV